MRLLLVGILLLLVLGVGATIISRSSADPVGSFEQCASAGNLVVMKNTNRCITPAGNIFVENAEEVLIEV